MYALIPWKYRRVPDFVDRHGIAVWADGIFEVIEAERFEHLVFIFIRALPELVRKQFPNGAPERDVTMRHLKSMFFGMRVEWSRKPISSFTRWGWAAKDRTGLQRGKRVLLQWGGSILQSAMYHEFMHVTDEVILKRCDVKHEIRPWWALLPELQRLALLDGL